MRVPVSVRARAFFGGSLSRGIAYCAAHNREKPRTARMEAGTYLTGRYEPERKSVLWISRRSVFRSGARGSIFAWRQRRRLP
jgi:hypothetical protein